MINATKLLAIIGSVLGIVAIALATSQGSINAVYGIVLICAMLAHVLYWIIDWNGTDTTNDCNQTGMERSPSVSHPSARSSDVLTSCVPVKYCSKCGRPLVADDNFCSYCGAKRTTDDMTAMQTARQEQVPSKNNDTCGTLHGGNKMSDSTLQIEEEELLQKMIDAADTGDAAAQCSLGACFQNGYHGAEKNIGEAIKFYRKAVAQGNPEAQFLLGACYYNGNGVEKNLDEAVRLFHEAATQGIAGAQMCLGTCYFKGEGVENNYGEALKWYRKAAEQGEAAAQFLLGACYYNGNGTDKDYPEAVKWFSKAATHGVSNAQFLLGTCYLMGYGVEKNYAEGLKWLNKAVEQGNEEARKVFLALSQAVS